MEKSHHELMLFWFMLQEDFVQEDCGSLGQDHH